MALTTGFRRLAKPVATSRESGRSETSSSPSSTKAISRREFLKYGSATAAGIGISSSAGEPSHPVHAQQSDPPGGAGRKPNVLIFIVDQLRADMVGCYGNSFTSTPTLDLVARRGVKFARAYCGFPQCSPARAALMTGMYPNRTGIGIQSDYRIFGDRTIERLDKDLPSIGTIFKAAGYQTGYVGKWHLSLQEPPDDIADYGFDFFSPLPEIQSKQYPLKVANQDNSSTDLAGYCEPNAIWSGEMSRHAEAFIERYCQSDAPFLLFYSDLRPHPPYFLPREEFQRYGPEKVDLWPNILDTLEGKPITQRRLRQIIREGFEPSDAFWSGVIRHYAAIVSATDHQIGLVYEALERNNLVENTIVVFISDHGDTCGAHGFWSKGVIAYEELIRIPMIISWPGHFQTDATCDRLVSLMDILPTLANATGIRLNSRQIDGQSLAPFLRGQESSDWRQHLLIMHHGNMYGLCTMRAVVGVRYKYVHYAYDMDELYDRSTDPWEMRNLIEDPGHMQATQALTEQLKALMEEASDTKVKFL